MDPSAHHSLQLLLSAEASETLTLDAPKRGKHRGQAREKLLSLCIKKGLLGLCPPTHAG